MLDDQSRPRRRLARGALLTLAVLASAAVAIVVGFAVYLFAAGYSGGSDPQSVAPLAFPIALILLVVGLPVTLICVLAWVGYSRASRGAGKGQG